jgi:iron complex outermembrane receptor protein
MPAMGQPSPADLTKLSLEDLMNISVSSAAKKDQKLGEAAAALYVITQEDLRRTGATTIADALRMVPGMEVAQINANSWAISARGFNSRFANKLLVLMDGRSVYTPLFSGVFWDVQDTLLEDIERIEVIRGPAGTLWGANAINGVINIITKNARETQGGLLTGGGGSHEQGFGSVRYGASIGADAHFRVFGKYFDRGGFPGGGTGSHRHDDWNFGRGGVRVDWDASKRDSLTFLGDFYDGSVGERLPVSTFVPPFSRAAGGQFPVSGGSLLGRWNRSISESSDLKLQMYYDRTMRRSPVHKETRDTVDWEFQHRFVPNASHEIIWGTSYRYTVDDIQNTPTITFSPASRGDHLFSAFIQDDLPLIENRLRLTLGSKFEYNSYTGFEMQPNVRVLWNPHEHHTLWAAVSRAVRTPSRFEHTIEGIFSIAPPLTATCPALVPCETRVLGNKKFGSESLIAYEIGYRTQLTPRVSVDIATFYHDYRDLRTTELGTPFPAATPVPHLVVPLSFHNKMHGHGYGIELSSTWNATEFWKVNLGYTFLRIGLQLDRTSRDTLSIATEGDSPQNQFHIRSYLDLPYRLSLDSALYYVDSVPNQRVPAYTRADVGIGWSPLKNFEARLVGQNLFDSSHRNSAPSF